MVIKQLLDLVRINDLSVGRYHRNVDDLYLDVRFRGFRTTSWRASLKLGKALLSSGDFCRGAAGLVDEQRVMLPVGAILQCQYDIADRLRFMLYAPRNDGMIDSLLGSLTRLQGLGDDVDDRKKRRSSKMRGRLARLDIDDLAKRIENFALSHHNVARSSMRGDLKAAASKAREIPSDHERREAAKLLREIALMWGLFDLQIVAARLFHCEHGGYANGSPDAPHAALTTESVGKMVKTLDRAGRAACIRIFKRTSSLTPSEQKELNWLDRFIEEKELRSLAVREGEKLGFSRTEMAGLDDVDPVEEEGLLRYLMASAFFAKQIKKSFERMEKNERTTLAGEAAISYPSRPAKGGKPPLPKKTTERYLEATIQRYGVSTVSALTFAAVSTITTVSRLPEGDALLKHGFTVAQSRGDPTSRTHEETDVIRQLIWLYRIVIVRDPNQFVHGFHPDDYRRLLDEAEADGFYDTIEPAPQGELTRMDWVMGRGLCADQKFAAHETAHGSRLHAQQARIPAEGLRDALALIRCIEDKGRKVSERHHTEMTLFGRSFSSSLDMRFSHSSQRDEWRRSPGRTRQIRAPESAMLPVGANSCVRRE